VSSQRALGCPRWGQAVRLLFGGHSNVKGRNIEKPSRFQDRQRDGGRWKVKEGKHITSITQSLNHPITQSTYLTQ